MLNVGFKTNSKMTMHYYMAGSINYIFLLLCNGPFRPYSQTNIMPYSLSAAETCQSAFGWK